MSMVLSEEVARLILERIKNRSTLVCGLAARICSNKAALVIHADARLIERTAERLVIEVQELLGQPESAKDQR